MRTTDAPLDVPPVRVRDHRVTVPVDRADPSRFGEIEVFARELVDPTRDGEDLPLLLFLQGGPGGMGPRPLGGGWWSTALRTHRVVLLDQRGTGRSGRVDGRTMARFATGTQAAEYLACFRADAVVEDAEAVRHAVYGGRRWATLGQSYGGFLTLTYLSRHPEALTACYVTGGLPGTRATAEDVYARTFPRQAARDAAFARRYPDDVARLGALADRLAAGDVRLPDGDPFTVRRLQTLGMPLGMSTGVDGLHWLLDTLDADADGVPDDAFALAVQTQTGFDANPLYAVLQEAIYHQDERAGGWAAQAERERHPGLAETARPLGLTGEAVFPWMFAEVRALRPFQEAAEALAARTSWPALYDHDRLAANEVPVAAVQYVHDPYVDLDLATGTADAVGNAQVWVTNEYLHDGLRAAGDVVLPRLVDLAAGRWSVTRG
ncbi:alpha/beta hydrolase [Cellulomonas triticagri]|uniref:Alpha/beta hydrolase n=1 Tax=Cellulomonas triticagri TaxID=2483352 RepID=A0A3M2J500_9CELL|nr:alpha/beta hydrolase [Cellulomonas triticagri]